MFWSFYVNLFVVFMSMVGYGIGVGGSLWDPFETMDNDTFRDAGAVLELSSKFILDTYDVGVLREYCPRNYCGFNSSDETIVNVTSKYGVCCLPCDCTEQCVELGNCCYDYEDFRLHPKMNLLEENREICTQTTIINSTAFPEELRLSYMLYQHCNNVKNESLVSKCYVPDERSITEQLPVYSNRTKRKYRNIYCAMCNGEQEDELTFWNGEYRCNSITDFVLPFQAGVDPSDVIISTVLSGLNYCALYFTPPVGTPATRCLHSQDMIANCHHDDTDYLILQDKCTAYHSPIYRRNTAFKNVFCLVCNNEQIEPFPYYADCWENAYGTFVPHLSIVALMWHDDTFSPGYEDDPAYLNDDNRCSPPSVFNDEINECLQRKCPLTSLPIGEKCFAPFQRVSNVFLDFRVFVTYHFSEQLDLSAILEQVSTLFTGIPNRSICQSSLKSAYVVGNAVMAHAQIVIHVDGPINLKRTFQTFVNNIHKYNADTLSIYRMDVGKEALMAQFPNSVYLWPFIDNVGTRCSGIAMSEMLFCPLVSSTSFTYLENTTVQLEGMLFEPHEYVLYIHLSGVDGVSICLDTYVTKYKKLHRHNMDEGSILVSDGSLKHIPALLYMFASNFIVHVLAKYNNFYMEMPNILMS